MIYVFIATTIFLVDSVIKFLIETLGTEHHRTSICNDKLFLTKYHNEGAFLNLGQTKKVAVKFVSLGLTCVCLLLFVFTLGSRGKQLLKLSLSMLLGGAFSNTCDRMTRGYVVDYFGLQVKNERLRNTIFNISDFFIIIGAMLSVLASPAKKKKQ